MVQRNLTRSQPNEERSARLKLRHCNEEPSVVLGLIFPYKTHFYSLLLHLWKLNSGSEETLLLILSLIRYVIN